VIKAVLIVLESAMAIERLAWKAVVYLVCVFLDTMEAFLMTEL